MTIKEAQDTVDNWIQTVGIRYFNELTNTALLMEEVGELARLMARQYGEQSFKPSETDKELSEEMADILFVLVCLANQTGVDLTSAFKKSLAKKQKGMGIAIATIPSFDLTGLRFHHPAHISMIHQVAFSRWLHIFPW